MKEYDADIDIRMMYRSRLDIAMEVLLVTLLAFMPFALSARSTWSEEAVVALSGAIIVCFLLRMLLNDGQRLVWGWSYPPLVLSFYAVLQLIPLSIHLMGMVSPNMVALRHELSPDLPDTVALKTLRSG